MDGGGFWGYLGAWGVPPHACTHMRMHAHAHTHMYRIANGRQHGGIHVLACLACLTCMCMCACMCAHACACMGPPHTHTHTHPHLHPKTVTSGKAHVPSPRMHNFKDAKTQGRKTATGVRSGRDVDASDGEQHS